MNNSNKDAVYNALASLGATDLGTREEFYAKLDIPANREKVYNALQMRGATDLGTFGEFDSKLGYTPRFSTEFSTEEIITPDSPFAPFKGMEKEDTNLEGMMAKIGGGIESTKQNLGTLDKIGQSTLGRMPLESLPTSLADIHSLTTDYASYRNLLMDNIKQGKVGREEYEFLETERAKGTKMVDEMLARAKEVRDSMTPSEYSTEVSVGRGGATANIRTTEGGKIDHLIESLEKLKRDYESYTTKADKELGGRGNGFWRGLDEFSLLDTVTAGWSDVLSGIDTALVLEKASSGQPLTKVEQLYLPMIEEKARLGEIVKAEGGLTSGYNIGAATAQMPSFIVGMMTTSPIGKGIEGAVKGVAKEATEQVVKKGFKDFMVKAGKSILSSGAYAAAATPLQSMMYDNYVDNTINEYLEFGGVNSSTAERLVKGYRQALPEIFFESLGGVMSGIAKYVLPKSGVKARIATKLAEKWGIHEGVMKDIAERAAFGGFLEETEEEVWTALLSPLVEGLSKEERQQRYGEAFSTEGIWTTIATTALVSGGFGIARGIESGIQVRNYNHLEQKALDALGNIKDANLRQMVFDAGEKGSLVETARAMAKIDWSAYDDGDVGNAIDYFRNNISRQVYAGVEVADQAEKALDGMAASIVGVQYGNSGKVITASVADSPVILLGVDTKTQTAMVRYEDGRREQVPLNEVKDQVTMPVDDLVAQLWGKEIEKVEAEVVPAQEAERKAKVEAMGVTTSTPQARTYNVGDMVNVNGEEGEIISISPASRTARVNTPSGEAIEVSLDEITPIEEETPIVEEEVVETITPTTQEAQPTEQKSQEAAQPQAKVEVPTKVEPVRNEKGEVDFGAMDVEQSASFIEEDMGEEQGLTFADARIAEQKAQLKKVESAKDVPTDYDAAKKVLSERKAMADAIKAEIAKWEAIKERVSAITAEKAQAEQTTPQVEEVAPVETTEQTEVVVEQAQETPAEVVTEETTEQAPYDPFKGKAAKVMEEKEAEVAEAMQPQPKTEAGVIFDENTPKISNIAVFDKVAKALGVRVVFKPIVADAKGRVVNAEYDDQTKTIYVGTQNRERGLQFLLGHEMLHRMFDLAPSAYKNFRDAAKAFVGEETFNRRVANTIAAYTSQGRNPFFVDIEQEVVADIAGELVGGRYDAFASFIEQNKTDKGFLATLRNILQHVKDFFKGSKAKRIPQNVDNAIKMLNELLAESSKQMKELSKAMEVPQEIVNAVEDIPNVEGAESRASIKIAPMLEAKSHDYLANYYGENKGKVSARFRPVAKGMTAEDLKVGDDAINAMVTIMQPHLDEVVFGKRLLPEEVYGSGYSTIFSNGSYGRSMENTSICTRTLAYNEFTDEIKEQIGRPLTTAESFLASQMLYDIAVDPQCLYCYVSLDRKAYDQELLRYMAQRDAIIEEYRAMEDKSPEAIKALYTKFLNGRKDTEPMRDRFARWIAAVDNNEPLITRQDLATKDVRNRMKEQGGNIEWQIQDAERYAQNAAQAKKSEDYRAYAGEILRMPFKTVKALSEEYGLRFYSFSEYSPAFIVENMQMIRDAALRGLRGFAYTKELDFVRIFAPSGININVSVFGRKNSEGNLIEDVRQGASWVEAQALREQHPNVGITFVATNDADVEWAMAQEWVDVVIPFHIVRTGADVAKFYGWTDYSSMQADKGAKKADIMPTEHKNNKETFLALCEERGLIPRFSKWVENPNYMKLVNETRRSVDETPILKPIFDLEAAQASWNAFVEKGGYYGGWYEVDAEGYNEAVAQVVSDIEAGKSADEVSYGRQDIPADYAEKARQARVNRTHGNTPRYSVKSNDAERREIEETAKANGTWLKAPNGNPSNLTPKQWVDVRTKAFKKWFGDWEKAARIEKLRHSDDVAISGNEIAPSEDIKEYRKNALEYGKTIRGEYKNTDTGEIIIINKDSLTEVLHHDGSNIPHIQSIAAIPFMVKSGVYITSMPIEENASKKLRNAKMAHYYVCGLRIGNVPYTVKFVVAEFESGDKYYDHSLTEIEKGELLNRAELSSTVADSKTPISGIKDNRLVSILQTNVSKVVDANGEPKVVWHGGDFAIDDFVPNGAMHFGTFKASTERLMDKSYGYEVKVERNEEGLYNWSFVDDFDPEFDRQSEVAFATEQEAYQDAFEHLAYVIKPYFLNIKNILRTNDAGDVEGWDEAIEQAKDKGFDGIIYRNGTEDKGSDSYLAFEPNQIKSASDNVGTFDANNPDIRYSIKAMDAPYLEAVERGDMETAQRMVDEAASLAGYSTDESWRMAHRAPIMDEENSNPYNTEKIVPEDFWTHPEWYSDIRNNAATRESYYNMKSAIDRYKRLVAEGKQDEADNVTVTMYRGVDKEANKREGSFRNGDWITPSRKYAVESAPYGKARVIEQQVPLKNIWWDGNSINEWGYYDGSNYTYADTKNNRKLLDPVTYDDAGNAIPLSERFDPRKADVRYSIHTMTPQEIEEGVKMANTKQKLPNMEVVYQMPDLTKEDVEDIRRRVFNTLYFESVKGIDEFIAKREFYRERFAVDLAKENLSDDKRKDLEYRNARNEVIIEQAYIEREKAVAREEYKKKGDWKRKYGVPLTTTASLTLDNLRTIFKNTNSDEALDTLFEKVYAVASTLPLTISMNGRMSKRTLGDVDHRGKMRINPRVFYDERVQYKIPQTILHELIHSCTIYATLIYDHRNVLGTTWSKLPKEMQDACAELDMLYDKVRHDADFAGMYGITNKDEFIAELANTKFREKLEAKNLWYRFVNAIKKFFGFDEAGTRKSNALVEAEKILDTMLNNFSMASYDTVRRIAISQEGAPLEEDANVRYSIGRRRQNEMATILENKRPDLSEQERMAVIAELDKLPTNKLTNVAFHYFAKGTIRIPEDMPKVEQAVKVAEVAKVDPMAYDSPMELINAHLDVKIKERPIDPDTVPTLTNKVEYGNGVTVYNVKESEESRQNMRKIINTHFGEDCSPWCLLQGDGKGNLTAESKRYWKHYNKYPKRVAFYNGRLIAFFASDSEPVWWDRQDQSHEGIPMTRKMPDGSGRTATYVFNEAEGRFGTPINIHKGKKGDKLYEEWWSHTDKLKSRERREGDYSSQEEFLANGTLQYHYRRMEDVDSSITTKHTSWGLSYYSNVYDPVRNLDAHHRDECEWYEDGKVAGIRHLAGSVNRSLNYTRTGKVANVVVYDMQQGDRRVIEYDSNGVLEKITQYDHTQYPTKESYIIFDSNGQPYMYNFNDHKYMLYNGRLGNIYDNKKYYDWFDNGTPKGYEDHSTNENVYWNEDGTIHSTNITDEAKLKELYEQTAKKRTDIMDEVYGTIAEYTKLAEETAVELASREETLKAEAEAFAKEADKKLGVSQYDESRFSVRMTPTERLEQELKYTELGKFETEYRAFVTAFANNMVYIKKLQEALKEAGVVITDSNNYYENENATTARIEAAMDEYDSKLVQPMLLLINELHSKFQMDYNAVTDYLLAKHSLERHNSGLNALNPNADAVWGRKRVEAIVNDFESKVPSDVVDQLWEMVAKINDRNLEILVEAGIKSKKDIDTIKSHNWKYYVPLKEWDLKAENLVDPVQEYDMVANHRNGAVKGKWFDPTAKGRTSKPSEPLGQIIAMGYRAIATGETNKAKQSLYYLLRDAERKLGSSISQYWELSKRYFQKNNSGIWEEVYGHDLVDAGVGLAQVEQEQREINKLERERRAAYIRANRLEAQGENADALLERQRGDALGVEIKNRKDNMDVRIDKPDMDYIPNEIKITDVNEKRRLVLVYVGGQPIYIKFTNPHIADAVNQLGVSKQIKPDVWANRIHNFVRWLTRFKSKVSTNLNPNFALLTNPVRDFLNAVTYHIMDTRYSSVADFVKNYSWWFTESRKTIKRAFKGKANPLTEQEMREAEVNGQKKSLNILNRAERNELISAYGKERVNDTLFEIYTKEGGQTGFAFVKDIQTIRNRVQKDLNRMGGTSKGGKVVKGLVNGFKAYSDAAKIAEVSTRYATFLASINKGMSVGQAVSNARNISVNFGRRGNLTSDVSEWYVFFNPFVQGLSQFADAFKRNKKRTMAVLMGFLIGGYINALLLDLGDGDEEDELTPTKAPSWMTRNYIVVRTIRRNGRDSFIRIPLPQLFRSIWALGSIAYDLQNGRIGVGDALGEAGKAIISDFTYGFSDGAHWLRSIAPTITQGVIDVSVNKDAWGRPIHREDIAGKGTPNAELGSKYVESWAYAIASILNKMTGGSKIESGKIDMNPSDIQYLFYNFLGGVGNTGRRLWELIKQGATFTKALKNKESVSDALDQAEFELQNIPILGGILYTVGEESAWDDYERLDKEYGSSLKTKENLLKEDDRVMTQQERVDYAKRHAVWQRYNKPINTLTEIRNQYKYNSDEYEFINREINRQRALLVKMMEEVNFDKNLTDETQRIEAKYDPYRTENYIQIRKEYGNKK